MGRSLGHFYKKKIFFTTIGKIFSQLQKKFSCEYKKNFLTTIKTISSQL